MDEDPEIWIAGYYGLIVAFRKRINQFVFGSFFDNFIILAVLANTIVMGMENLDKDSPSLKSFREQANLWFTILFVGELMLKCYALGIGAYCRDSMNLFDAIIVFISVFDLVFLSEDET